MELTAEYLWLNPPFPPPPPKKKACDHKKKKTNCILLLEAVDWKVCFLSQAFWILLWLFRSYKEYSRSDTRDISTSLKVLPWWTSFDYSIWYCLILLQISRKKKIKNFQEHIDSNFSKQLPSFQRTFAWNREQVCISANGRFWSEVKWWVTNIVTKKIQIYNYFLPKFNTNYWVNEREVVSHFILRPVLYPGSHLLQISLKALFKYWKFHFPQLRAEWKKIVYTKWSPVTEEKSDFLCKHLVNVRQTITVSRAD